MFASVGNLFLEKKEELCEMDARLGDGDLGLTMSKGFASLPDLLRESSTDAAGDVGRLLMKAGMKMSSLVPSTMGFLMSSGIMEGGKAVKGRSEMDGVAFADYLVGFAAGIQKRGKCQTSQRTIYDSIKPAADAAKSCVEMNAQATLVEVAEAALQAWKPQRTCFPCLARLPYMLQSVPEWRIRVLWRVIIRFLVCTVICPHK